MSDVETAEQAPPHPEPEPTPDPEHRSSGDSEGQQHQSVGRLILATVLLVLLIGGAALVRAFGVVGLLIVAGVVVALVVVPFLVRGVIRAFRARLSGRRRPGTRPGRGGARGGRLLGGSRRGRSSGGGRGKSAGRGGGVLGKLGSGRKASAGGGRGSGRGRARAGKGSATRGGGRAGSGAGRRAGRGLRRGLRGLKRLASRPFTRAKTKTGKGTAKDKKLSRWRRFRKALRRIAAPARRGIALLRATKTRAGRLARWAGRWAAKRWPWLRRAGRRAAKWWPWLRRVADRFRRSRHRHTPEDTEQPDTPKLAPAGPPVSPGAPVIPGSPSTTPSKEKIMSTYIGGVVEAIQQGIGGFEPPNEEELDAFLKGLPEVFAALAESLNRLAGTLGEEFPVDHAVAEHLREVGAASAGIGDSATEVHPIYAAAHEAEKERLDNPRTNEEFFDVSNQ